MTEDRYSRQRRLAEVGDSGQALIEGTNFEVCGQDGADVERAYLERAGARAVTVAPGIPVEFRHATHFRFSATRSVGAGAWRALAQLRPLLTGALPPRLADATAPPPPSAGSLRSRGDDEGVDAELLKERRS